MALPKFIIKLLYSLQTILVITTISASIAHADYLDMSLSATKYYIIVSMNYYQNATYKVKWKKSNNSSWTEEPDQDAYAGLQSGNCTTTSCSYWIDNLSCNTSYKVRAKMEGRGWRTKSISTSGCGTVACPYGGWFDGANCQIGKAPDGTTAFIWGGNYYYTPLPSPNRCPYRPYPNSGFDLANCYVQPVPAGVLPFIWANHWYYVAYP